jgi:chemotaxis response regulator CheB
MGLKERRRVPTTVLIADDNASVRTALHEFFDREPDFQVGAMAENGLQAIELASRLRPDLIARPCNASHERS